VPASVAAANPTTVLPYSLCVAFQFSLEWAVDENTYRGGEVQRQAQVATSRKAWSQSKRLTTAELDTLRTFYLARKGGMEEFWFYDLWETVPKLSQAGYDATGSATAGRYAVRFEGGWQEALQLGRHEGAIVLVEVS
jgi:hypothetical protein